MVDVGEAFGAVQGFGNQFPGEEVGDFRIRRFVVVMDFQLAGHIKACMAVECDVAFHAEEAHAKGARLIPNGSLVPPFRYEEKLFANRPLVC